MNIDKIIEILPEKSNKERAMMRENAEKWLTSGTPQQKAAAQSVKEAIETLESSEKTALYELLKDQPVAARVREAFRAQTNKRIPNPGAQQRNYVIATTGLELPQGS